MSVDQAIPRIQKLSNDVANQIAAGEVIERPASVVKELIENSIDASATDIHIDIENAGKSLIHVRDNGQGIHKDDLKLALQAHATSKLSQLSDLTQIVSLGFRGEALPSIASISNFKLTSCMHGETQAWSINNSLQIKPAAHEKGTSIEVRDLFYSAPARRKFLKSDRTEQLHIQSLIRAIALSQFSIGFFVKQDSQPLYQLAACSDDPDRRIHKVCGRTFLNRSIRIDTAQEGLRLWGWLGLSEVTRSQSDRQYFYVNGRLVRDKHINHAIRLAYEHHIPIGRFPAYVLHMNIEPEKVDVNVHPAKSEVRFADTRDVHDFIYSQIYQNLDQPLVPVQKDPDYQTENEVVSLDINEPVTTKYEKKLEQEFDYKDKALSGNFVLIKDRFMVTRLKKDFYLIDLPRTRSFMVRESLIKNYKLNTITQRPVLVPLSFDFSEKDIEFLINNDIQVKRWGFELQQVSPTQMSIRAIPYRLHYANACQLLESLLLNLKKNKATDEIAEALSVHVNDSGQTLNNEDLMKLIEEIAQLQETSSKYKYPWKRLDEKSLLELIDR